MGVGADPLQQMLPLDGEEGDSQVFGPSNNNNINMVLYRSDTFPHLNFNNLGVKEFYKWVTEARNAKIPSHIVLGV